MKKSLLVIMILLLMLGAVGCSGESEQTESTSNTKATTSQMETTTVTNSQAETQPQEETKAITIGMTWAIGAVEPTNDGNPWSLTSCGISESVFRQNREGILISRFVSNMKQIDALNWEVTLNEDVTFSDGTPVDAEAFCQSLNTIMEENPLSNATAGKIMFTPTGNYTLTATTERETKVLNSVFCEWTNIIFKQLDDGTYVFTGPYVIDTLDSGVSLTLMPNQYYPDADKRGNLILKAFQDVSAMKLAIESEEIDMAFTVTPEVAEMLKQEGIKVKTIEAGYQYFAPVNLNGIMADDKLRQAVNYALNREEYIAALGGGHLPTGTFASYNSFAGKIELNFDINQANALLDEAGYTLNDNKMREKDGQVLTLNLVTYPSRPDLSVIMQVMVTQLKAVGINAKTQIVENIDEELKAGNYDIALYAQHTSPTGNPAFYLNQFFRTNGSKNMMGYSSADFDALLNQMAKLELGSEMDQVAADAQALLYQELPILLIDDPQWHVALSKRLADYTPYCGDYYIINDQLFEK